MSDLYSRFLYYSNLSGKKPSRVLQEAGLHKSLYTHWKNGGKMTDSTAVKLAEYFGVTLAEFANGGGETAGVLDTKYAALDAHGKALVDMILEAEYSRCVQPVEKVVPIPTIRHYLSRPAAGVGGLVEGEDFEDIPLPEDAPKDADYCLTVSGDSMEPVIHDGQMVFVKRDVPLEPQDIGVFIVDGEAFVKQFFPGISGQTYLVSANPKRQDANITLLADSDHSVFYAGKVLI